jgi:hypothetical protein
MNSEISIDRAAGLKTRPTGERKPDAEVPHAAESSTFSIWHFFVLLSLMAATVAVLLARQTTPENLVLITLTIGAAGAAAAGLYRMLSPLATPEAEFVSEPLSDRLRADLEREKILTLRSIKELEFDRAMGKLSAQDFEEMAGRLRVRALGLMRQLDASESSPYRTLIEKDVEVRIGKLEKPAVKASLVGLCTCGVQNDADARFCKACGSKLEGTKGTE